MNRGKKIVILSHCILNQNSVVKPYAKEQKYYFEFIKNFLLNNCGIIQLPCPELLILGLKRWGHVKDQFEYPYFKRECESLLYPIINQIENYIDNGYEIVGVYGVQGSPSCGVNKTCRGNWEGEASCYKNLDDIVKRVQLVSEKGIFMETFEKLLNKKNIELNFYDIDDWSE